MDDLDENEPWHLLPGDIEASSAWMTKGVVLSDLDGEGRRTATVQRDGPRRFLRLRVMQD